MSNACDVCNNKLLLEPMKKFVCDKLNVAVNRFISIKMENFVVFTWSYK